MCALLLKPWALRKAKCSKPTTHVHRYINGFYTDTKQVPWIVKAALIIKIKLNGLQIRSLNTYPNFLKDLHCIFHVTVGSTLSCKKRKHRGKQTAAEFGLFCSKRIRMNQIQFQNQLNIPYTATFFSVLLIKCLCNFWTYSDSVTGPVKLCTKMTAELYASSKGPNNLCRKVMYCWCSWDWLT